jgi:hypothetical protein
VKSTFPFLSGNFAQKVVTFVQTPAIRGLTESLPYQLGKVQLVISKPSVVHRTCGVRIICSIKAQFIKHRPYTVRVYTFRFFSTVLKCKKKLFLKQMNTYVHIYIYIYIIVIVFTTVITLYLRSLAAALLYSTFSCKNCPGLMTAVNQLDASCSSLALVFLPAVMA